MCVDDKYINVKANVKLLDISLMNQCVLSLLLYFCCTLCVTPDVDIKTLKTFKHHSQSSVSNGLSCYTSHICDHDDIPTYS